MFGGGSVGLPPKFNNMKIISDDISNANLLEYLKFGIFPEQKGIAKPEEYNIYGKHYDLCPFCNRKSITNKFPIVIEQSEKGISSGKNTPSFLCSYHGKVMSEFKNKHAARSSLLNPRIQHYLRTEELPQNANLFAVGNSNENRCIFCSTRVSGQDTMADYNTMHIEVGKYPEILGFVKMCRNCSNVLDNFADKNTLFEELTVVSDSCVECGSQYALTMREYDTRKLKDTVGKHICPDCCDDKYHMTNYDRFVQLQCEDCTTQEIVDRTLLPGVSTYRCTRHSYAPVTEDTVELYFGEGDEIRVYLYKVIDIWAFEIFDNITNKKLASSKISTNFRTIEEAAFIGSLLAERFLTRKMKQKTLF